MIENDNVLEIDDDEEEEEEEEVKKKQEVKENFSSEFLQWKTSTAQVAENIRQL